MPRSSAESGEGVVVDVVDHRDNISLGVYRREEGEETINTEKTSALLSMTKQKAALGVF